MKTILKHGHLEHLMEMTDLQSEAFNPFIRWSVKPIHQLCCGWDVSDYPCVRMYCLMVSDEASPIEQAKNPSPMAWMGSLQKVLVDTKT